MNIRTYLETNIEDSHVTSNEFGDIIIYLLDQGVICRPTKGTHSERDPLVEIQLYDKFIRVKKEIIDYLSIIGMGIYHNEEFQSIRIYAPDAEYPNDNEIKDDGSTLMRFTIGKDLSAAIIICYMLYEQYRGEGRLEDDFTAVVSQQEFMSAFAAILGIDYDATRTRGIKDEVYRSLKRMRAINYHGDFFSSNEYPVIIRPLIYDIVMEDTIKNTIEQIEEGKQSNEN